MDGQQSQKKPKLSRKEKKTRQSSGYLSQDLLVNRLNQIGTQASLIGGFAFAAITSVQNDPSQPLNSVVPYFTVITAVSVGLNVLAITILTLMNVTIASARVHPEGFIFYSFDTNNLDQKSVAQLNQKLKLDYYIALFSFLGGLITFLVSLMFIIFLRMVIVFTQCTYLVDFNTSLYLYLRSLDTFVACFPCIYCETPIRFNMDCVS